MGNWMELAKFIAAIATPIAIGAGFWFARRQLIAQRNTRMAEIILHITERWDSNDMKECRMKVHGLGDKLKATIEAEVGKPDSQEILNLVKVANFFDSLGLMVMEGFISCPMAYQLFGRAEEEYYNYYRSILEDARYKEYFQYFIQLHDAFVKEKARCSPIKPRPTH